MSIQRFAVLDAAGKVVVIWAGAAEQHPGLTLVSDRVQTGWIQQPDGSFAPDIEDARAAKRAAVQDVAATVAAQPVTMPPSAGALAGLTFGASTETRILLTSAIATDLGYWETYDGQVVAPVTVAELQSIGRRIGLQALAARQAAAAIMAAIDAAPDIATVEAIDPAQIGAAVAAALVAAQGGGS